MKNIFFLLALIVLVNSSCNKQYLAPDFQNELAITFSRSDESDIYEKTIKEDIYAAISANAYTVLNVPNERELRADIYFNLDNDSDIPLTGGSLEIIWTVPDHLFQNTEIWGEVKLKKPEDYKALFKQSDTDQYGIRGCLNHWYVNSCATKGWFGDAETVDIKLKKHRLFEDENGNSKVYLEGNFHIKTTTNTPDNVVFELDGQFKIVLDL